MKLLSAVFALALLSPAGPVWAQGNPSPDTQQEKNGQSSPPAHANAPGTGGSATSTAQSPDQQQGAAGAQDKSTGKHHKTRNNARQAHGDPKPAPSTTSK